MNTNKFRWMAMGTAALALSGCDAVKDAIDAAGITVNVVGTLNVSGDEPESRSVVLYTAIDNPDAFDASVCTIEGTEVPGCSGRIDVSKLNTPVDQGATSWDGDSFTVADVTLSSDLGFVAVLTGSGGASCTQDIIGFDETTKLVTVETMITLDVDLSDPTATDVTEFDMPRDGNIRCEAPVVEPTPPPAEEIAEPEEPPEEVLEEVTEVADDGSVSISGDGVDWTSFSITDGTSTADASEAAVSGADNPMNCEDGIAPVLMLSASTDADISEAFVRIQVGEAVDGVPVYLTDRVKVSGGDINWKISLPGGYAVVQVDTNAELDGEGESLPIEFCSPAKLPAQELWVNTTWDMDDTDIDTHVTELGSMSEIAYYSSSRDWGSLDIDVIYGYGPENVKSTPGYSSDAGYEVKIHYYSDHGNGPTDTTVRVVYVDPDTLEVCDIIATQPMRIGGGADWWTVGTFGPGFACPE
jgi:hypothetical protein